MSYEQDRSWSDRYISTIKRLLGPQLLEPAAHEWDTTRATDLTVLRARNLCIAARVRRAGYADRYPYDITLRSARDSGARTELEKIVDGWGDMMFYGHADATGDDFTRWWLIDLHAFRAALIRDRGDDSLRWSQRSNGDGTHFVTFDLRSFPRRPPIVVASSHGLMEAVAA